MHKVLNKTIAILLTIMLAGANFISVGVYASSTLNQSTATTEENVEFNATIENGYSVKADVSSELKLNLTVKVSNTGYLKDGIIKLDGNNYEITTTSNENVKSINGNTIELNQVNAGEVLNVELPIKINKTDLVSVDEFNKDSTITLNATYVNEKGKEKKINKALTEHVEWTANAVEKISETLVRYLKYDTNKTMISFSIKDGIENNLIPAINKEIIITVPQINSTNPSKVVVTQNNDESNTNSSMSYEYKDGNLVINKKNEANADGRITWNSEDTYMVTYIYDTTSTETEQSITTSARAKITTIKGDIVAGNTEINDYNITAEVGSIVELEVNGATEINKGYMYTNINRVENKLDTNFEVIYKANIGYADLIDKMILSEKDSKFNNEKEKEIVNATGNITDKKVKVTLENLIKILGETGTITVKDSNANVIGTLNKDTLELEVNANTLTFETSKPQAEGNLNITVDKTINGTAVYTKAQVDSFKNITSTINVDGYKDNNNISAKVVSKKISLTEPTSSATLNLSTNTLSTVVENKDITMNVLLKTTDISNALYTNPTVKITLPTEVKNISITDSKLLYDDELAITDVKAEGNIITATLKGTQTKYSDKSSEGSLIRLVANITLDNLAPSAESLVTLNYTNEATGESKDIDNSILIVAPTGFVTTNTLKVNDKSVTAQESEAKEIKVDNNSTSKEMKFSGTIVNNLGYDATGVTILGRIPFKGNKSIQGEDLGTTVDTQLSEAITTTGIDETIYYSTNGEETINGTSWTTTYSKDAKSFKIVANGTMNNKTSTTFNYTTTLPANLDYGNIAKATYGVYYNNNAKEGNTQNLVEAKAVGITTGAIPQLSTKISAVDTNEGYAIDDGGTVTEGEYITYKAKVTNTGNEDATNVKVTIKLPNEIAFVNYVESTSMDPIPTYSVDKKTKEATKTIDTIKAGESSTVEFTTTNTQIISLLKSKTESGEAVDIEAAKNLTTNFEISADKIEEIVKQNFTVKNTEGTLHIDLVSNASEKVKKNQEIIYSISVKNVNRTTKNNVVVKLQLPDGIEYNGTEYTSNYDKTSNTVTINIGTLEANSTYSLIANAKVTTDATKLLTTVATIKCDENANEVKSNSIVFDNTVAEKTVTATQTANISDGTLLDTDDLEFYIDIKNNGTKSETLTFEDILPTGITVKNYKLVVDGNEIQKTTGGYIKTSFELPSGKSARATITTKVETQEKDSTLDIENKPTLITTDNTSIEINTIKLKITGTGIVSTDKDQETADGTYKISGIAWYDKNFDAKKDQDEEKLSGIKITLYDKSTGSIAKDSNGEELTITTDNDGRYTFINVKAGNYIVVSEINNAQYDLTTYKAEGLSETENSDFVMSKLNGADVAATDTIQIKDSNIYNIDLGLTSKKKFDLKLEKTVSKITVTNTKAATKIYNYDKNVAKVELSTRNVEYATVLVEYTIKITNEGQIAGYAKSIVDYLPEGMTFNSELNNNWYVGKDGNGYNTSLANTIINPGETKEITLVLSRKMTGENTGTVRNTAEILTSYNEYGIADIDSVAGNKKDAEDDISSADSIILMSTGKEIASFTGITLGILSLIALAIYVIKKYIINKMYSNIL